MIIVKNDMIPVGHFKAMNIWPFIFVQEDEPFNKVDERHEMIHGRQQEEMFFIGIVLAAMFFFLVEWWSLFFIPVFFYFYIIEWIVRLFIYRDKNKAYRTVSFEQEAYDNQEFPEYLEDRKAFAWIKYIFKKQS